MDRRSILQGAVSLIGATAIFPANVMALAAAQADAERLQSGAVHLRWSGLKGPTQIFASPNADAQPTAMTLVSKAALGSSFETAQPKSPRPYFLLRASGSSVRTAERLLPLDGARNFRDMGGYRAKGGRQVRWGRLYRSGEMTELAADDITYLSKLGIRAICDLRTEDERKREPAPFSGASAPQITAYPYDMSGGAMKALMSAKTREDAIAAFSDSYVEMTSFLTPHLTDLFTQLKRQEVPLAVNCTAGKDRTGITSALILSVLGVQRETVIADYALTERYQPAASYIKRARAGANAAGAPTGRNAALASIPDEVMSIIMGSDPEVMRRALAKIDAKFGGPVELVKARYGVSAKDIAHLQDANLYQS